MGFVDVTAPSLPTDRVSPADAVHDADRIEGFNVAEIASHAWDDLASGFRDVVHEQTEVFNAPRWGSDRLKRLGFFENGKLVGAVLSRDLTLPGTSIPFNLVRWGPMWRPVGMADDTDRLVRLYRAIREVLADRNGGFLALIPHSDPVHREAVDLALKANGFRAQAPSEAPERYFVSMEDGPEAVKASFAQKWRYNLKKAMKAGLTTEWESSPAGLSAFEELYAQMVDRKQFFDRTAIDSVSALLNAKTSSLRPEIVLVRKDDVPVAGAVIDTSGERAIYLYGASSRAALPLRAGYLMQWEVIERLASMGTVRWYDLGGADTAGSSLHQFKRGMIGKTGVMSDQPPMYVYGGSPLASFLGTSMLKARAFKNSLEHRWHILRHGRDGGAAG